MPDAGERMNTQKRNWCNDVGPSTSVCVCAPSRFDHVSLCMTLWTGASKAPLSMGFSTPWDLPNPGMEPGMS